MEVWKYDFGGTNGKQPLRENSAKRPGDPSSSFREQYHLEKGDMVVFIETEDGILIKPAKLVLKESLDAMGKELRNKGVDLNTWLNLSEKSREETSHSED